MLTHDLRYIIDVDENKIYSKNKYVMLFVTYSSIYNFNCRQKVVLPHIK